MSFHPSLRLNKIAFILLGLFLLLVSSFSSILAAEAPVEGEVLAIGEAPVVKGNAAQARQAAISQALMKGVEGRILQLLGREASAPSFERITEAIIPANQDAVENFHILAEKQINDRYKILVRLKINEDMVRQRLESDGLLLTKTSPVSILFLISETRDGDVSYWWKDADGSSSLSLAEIALHEAFQSRGIIPVNRTLSLPHVLPDPALAAADLKDSHIVSWGRLFSADVVVYGQLRIAGRKAISLTARAIHVSDGHAVCQASVAGKPSQEPVDAESFLTTLTETADRLAGELVPCITGAVEATQEKQAPLTVTLAGIWMPKQFWQFSSFLLDDVAGVTSVIPSKIKGDTMSVTVVFDGDRSTFINRVLNHSKRPFPLTAKQVAQRAVVFTIE
jgi:hypothetical protein